MKQRSLTFWAILALAVIVVTQTIAFLYDVVRVDGRKLDDTHLADITIPILFVLFWGAVLVLIAVAVAGYRRRRRRGAE